MPDLSKFLPSKPTFMGKVMENPIKYEARWRDYTNEFEIIWKNHKHAVYLKYVKNYRCSKRCRSYASGVDKKMKKKNFM